MSMLRSLFRKDYRYRDNYGDVDERRTISIHLARSTWESDVLHIGMTDENNEDLTESESVTMNLTLEEVKELAAVINAFIQSEEQRRKVNP